MPEMMKEVVLALDSESRELAQQLATDLRDLLAIAPEWARPLADGIAELRRAAKQQTFDALLQSINSKADALAKATERTSTAVALLTTQAESRELAQKVTTDVAALLRVAPSWSRDLVDGIAELRSAAALQKTESALQALLSKTDALARASANTNATLATLATSSELASQSQAENDRAHKLQIVLQQQQERLGAIEGACAALTRALADQNAAVSTALQKLGALQAEANSSAALLQRLNRPWYRRIFGG